jgi:hypothetical protein
MVAMPPSPVADVLLDAGLDIAIVANGLIGRKL